MKLTNLGAGDLQNGSACAHSWGLPGLGSPLPFHHLTLSSVGEQPAAWSVEALTLIESKQV